MTKQELTDLIGYESPRLVEYAIENSKTLFPGIVSEKKKNNFLIQDYTKEEIECICKSFPNPMNELQIELILDNFTSTGKKYIDTIPKYKKGTEEFLKTYNKKHHKACGSCIYLIGKSYRTGSGKLYPFCTFYNRFLSTIKITKRNKEQPVDMFKDHCSSYVKGKPKIFEK